MGHRNVDLQLAEIPAEGDVLLIADRLVGKDQHEVLHPEIVDARPRRGIEGLGQIYSSHLGSDQGVAALGLDRAGRKFRY
jgi:hypothetical protein